MSVLLTGDTVAQWPVWSTTARVVVTEPGALPDARALVEAELPAVDAACSRFRPDSELAVAERAGEEVEVSELLAELVGAALDAARHTDGDVDPTLGDALARLGYDRDLPLVPPDGPAIPVQVRPAPGWRRIGLDGRRLSVPPGVRLDLGATAKAWTADRCARLAAGALDTGVLVELGGDLATAGAGPPDGWRVYVADQPGDPACVVAVPSGSAMATSSTNSRSWHRGARRRPVLASVRPLRRAPHPGPPGGSRMTALLAAMTGLFDAAAPDLRTHLAHAGPLPRRAGALVGDVRAAGLTGRGGAGFPVWRKLATVAEGRDAAVIGNAAESEPASSKDHTLLVRAPHLVLDGLQLAAETVRAGEAYLYVPAGAAAEAVRKALAERRDALPVTVVIAPDYFVAGQESAVVAAVEGRPHFRPTGWS